MSTLLLVSTGIFIVGMIVMGIVFAVMRSKSNMQINDSNNEQNVQEEEKKYIRAFIAEHPNFTEESLRNLLNQYADQLIIRKPTYRCSQQVYQKAPNDGELTQLHQMNHKATNVIYENGKLDAGVIYTNFMEDYMLKMTYTVMPNAMVLEKYEILKKT